ncbi:MAG: elongation factor G [Candidatus Treponema excrementipullorum]|nr:elongation factor G [Spirochaetia bacterium]MDY4464909.1 elongation factor G [Candidatus Treponema excrementipullorum]
MDYSTTQLRNISIAGHGQTGKTTLFEHLLFVGGAIPKAESVASGKTVSDNTPEEIQRKISIHASLANVPWKDRLINIWDTPGSSDFNGEVTSAFRASGLAVMLVDSRSGAQIETIKLWRDLDRRNKPRLVFLNHCEEDRSDVEASIQDIRKKFSAEVCAVTIPMGVGADFKGVIDVLHNKAYLVPAEGKTEEAIDIPAEYKDAYEEALGVLAGAAAEGDDDLLVKFIDEGELTPEEIIAGLKIAVANNRIVPAFAGNPEKNSGLVSLLDFIAEIAPDPTAAIETALSATGEKVSVKYDPQAPFTALCVKTANDQFSGKLSYLKVVCGTLNSDSEVFNLEEKKKEKIGKLYRCVGKKLEEVKSVQAGDICIASKLVTTKTSETLAATQDGMSFVRLRMPEPVYSIAVSAKEKRDEDKLSTQLLKATEEDRTLSFSYNTETKQNVVSGMGELQIGIILEKIKAQSKIDIQTSVPRIAYRETINRKAQAEYTHKKQSGGHGQYARVVLAIEPLERGENYAFANAVVGGAISKGYIPGVEKGVKEAMENGVLAGYPVVDVSITVLDGKEHPVDSSEMAFKIAARNAFKDAMRSAGPVLLEPVMNITVWVESKYLGDIMSDLSGKRGRVLGQNSLPGGIEEIRALVPQSELLKYAIDLRSLTSGTGSFETSFSHYDPISGKLADEVIAAAKEFIQVATED